MFIDNTEVYYLENFLTEDELAFFDQRAASFVIPPSSGEERWAEILERLHDIFLPEEKSYNEIMAGVFQKVYNLCNEVLNMEPDWIVQGISHFNMLYPPLSMKSHWDGTTPGVHYGIVIYVSDPSDYEGGEIVYVNKDISIKPSRGSIVIHPATEPYEHGVNHVTSGLRVAMTSFIQEEKHVGGPGNQDGTKASAATS